MVHLCSLFYGLSCFIAIFITIFQKTFTAIFIFYPDSDAKVVIPYVTIIAMILQTLLVIVLSHKMLDKCQGTDSVTYLIILSIILMFVISAITYFANMIYMSRNNDVNTLATISALTQSIKLFSSLFTSLGSIFFWLSLGIGYSINTTQS